MDNYTSIVWLRSRRYIDPCAIMTEEQTALSPIVFPGSVSFNASITKDSAFY